MSKRSALTGYTLIEILVVVAIMAILFGVGIAAYSRFDRVRKVEQAALSFGMYLRETQKNADAGVKTDSCTGEFEGLQVLAAASANTSEEIAYCPAALTPIIKALNSPAKFDDPFNVMFRTVGRGVTVTNGQTTITDANNSVRYKVTVDPGGAITVEKTP